MGVNRLEIALLCKLLILLNKNKSRIFNPFQSSKVRLGKPGVDKLRIHDIRHSAATNLARAGKDMKFIAQYLGHSDVRTSARYVHYSDDDLKEGSEVLAQVPSKVTTPKLKRVAPPASS